MSSYDKVSSLLKIYLYKKAPLHLNAFTILCMLWCMKDQAFFSLYKLLSSYPLKLSSPEEFGPLLSIFSMLNFKRHQVLSIHELLSLFGLFSSDSLKHFRILCTLPPHDILLIINFVLRMMGLLLIKPLTNHIKFKNSKHKIN